MFFRIMSLVVILGLQLGRCAGVYTATPDTNPFASDGTHASEHPLFRKLAESDLSSFEQGLASPPTGIGSASDGFKLVKRVVWNPRITSPAAGTVWVAGSTVKVTWYVTHKTLSLTAPLILLPCRDTSAMPQQVANAQGKVLLGHLEDGADEHLDVGTFAQPRAHLGIRVCSSQIPSRSPLGTELQFEAG